MTNRYLQFSFGLFVILSYCLMVAFVQDKVTDFTSFYAAILSLLNNENPYTHLYSHFLVAPKPLAINLNPPFVLWFFSPLAKWSYPTAHLIWMLFSLTLGLIGAGIAFYYAVSDRVFKENWLLFLVVYLALFATMANFIAGQFGSILLFFLMGGYYFYIKKQEVLAGTFWGLIIAIKFFPALLIFFLLKQRRFKVLSFTLITAIISSFIPFFVYNQPIYSNYFSMMTLVSWYGDNWNASVLGYLFRLLKTNYLTIAYLIFAFIFFISYLKKLGPNIAQPINHQPFCFTLIMMLLLSPLGWFYYFPILIFPLILIWLKSFNLQNASINALLLWIFTLILINFPQGYINHKDLGPFFLKILYFSCFFYGLIFLNYLCGRQKLLLGKQELIINESNQSFHLICFCILIYGVLFIDLKMLLYEEAPDRELFRNAQHDVLKAPVQGYNDFARKVSKY